MDLPLAYIPVDRRLSIARGVDLPDRCHGAVLFADISGFTPLTETLTKELGPKRGADELTKRLDTIYDALIAQVERYRGSVIGFAGDAITCWFDDGPEPAKGELTAIAAALAMQQAMSDYATMRTARGTAI